MVFYEMAIIKRCYGFIPYSNAYDYYLANLKDGDKVRSIIEEEYHCKFIYRDMTISGICMQFDNDEDYTWFVLKWS
jgi:hypothetical protein